MPEDSNSIELTILLHSPQMVARTFDQARSNLGDHRDRLRRKFLFVDSLLRYFFSVLAAEFIGLGLSRPDSRYPAGCKDLIKRLANPSWGNWSTAIESLAENVLSAERKLVSEPFANAIIERNALGKCGKSTFMLRLIDIINLRNKLAHADGSLLCTEREAKRHLRETLNPALKEVVASLRFLTKRPLFYVNGSREDLYGEVISVITRFAGERPEQEEVRSATKLRLKENYPFLLDESGTVLYLAPLIVVESSPVSGAMTPWMIDGWNDQEFCPTYESPDGRRGQVLSLPEGVPTQAKELFSIPPNVMRLDSAVDREVAKTLVDARRIPLRIDIDHLEIDEERPLGCGASGTVYRARYKPHGDAPREWFALKVLHGTTLIDVQRKRLEEEYRILSSISHRCLPKVVEFGYEPLPYFLMERIPGTSLQARIERGALPLETVLWVAREILGVLEIVHAEGIIHRDLKPSNIMIANDNSSLKVIDFGIALTDSNRRFTGSLERLGTLGYAAPEQLRGEEIDHRADIFGLGRVLEDCLIGMGDLRSKEIPPGFLAIIRSATQPNRDHRFHSAVAMLAAIDERQHGGWQGVPVQGNSPLDANHELLSNKHHLDGIWLFDAVEVETRRPESIALAVDADARQRLLEAVRRQPHGSFTTQSTSVHSILYTVMPPSYPLARLLHFDMALPCSSVDDQTNCSPPPPKSKTSVRAPSLRSRLLARLKKLESKWGNPRSRKKLKDLRGFYFEITEAIESILLVWVLHTSQGKKIDIELWKMCPTSLGGVLHWMGANLGITDKRVHEFLQSLQPVVEQRNMIAHGGVGFDTSFELRTPHREPKSAEEPERSALPLGRSLSPGKKDSRESQQLTLDLYNTLVRDSGLTMIACSFLRELIEKDIPKTGPGEEPPFLTYNRQRQVWVLMRSLRNDVRYEAYDNDWERRLDIEEGLALQALYDAEQRKIESSRAQEQLHEYLSNRPYTGFVQKRAKSQGGVIERRAEYLVHSHDQQAILLAEPKILTGTRNAELQHRRWIEQLWRLAKEFMVPYALLDVEGRRYWFEVDPWAGLRELPNDEEIIAKFGTGPPDGRKP